jgi:hypothetical protein
MAEKEVRGGEKVEEDAIQRLETRSSQLAGQLEDLQGLISNTKDKEKL